MEINSETRKRIIATAEKLFEDAGRERYPTVDQVRRAAKADMNTASAVMKEWRREQIASSGVPPVEVPARIQEVFKGLLAEVWVEAQALSNESLNAAQAAWATERAEEEALRNEVSEAYEAQAQELEVVRQQLAAALEQVQAGEQIRERQASELAELSAAKQQRDYEATNALTELHAAREALDTLRSELARAQAGAEAQASVAAERQQDAAARLESVLAELEKVKQEAVKAREHAAGLAGQLEAITAQNRELMDALKR
jgi:colicin import membrane protein